jgi:serine kinase of HPr protein (carbohydrate metabolism regulator)
MKINDIIEPLNLTVITGETLLEREINDGYVGDLLSVVMGKAPENCAWITVQSHINIIAVATLADVGCIIVSEGFSIDDDAVEKAKIEEVVLLSSRESSYSIAKKLGQMGL